MSDEFEREGKTYLGLYSIDQGKDYGIGGILFSAVGLTEEEWDTRIRAADARWQEIDKLANPDFPGDEELLAQFDALPKEETDAWKEGRTSFVAFLYPDIRVMNYTEVNVDY